MDTNQLTAWVAGRIEASSSEVYVTEGPTKPYVAIGIDIPGDEAMANRFTTIANNGTYDGRYWHLGGYAAIRGFAQTMWPYLSPAARQGFNKAFRTYKKLKAGLKHGGNNASI